MFVLKHLKLLYIHMYIRTLFHCLGPNDFSLFQPRQANTLYEVAGKLMFYYHAKGCYDNKCPDLSPLHIPGTTLDAKICAPVYSSWEVKVMLLF